jgi:hypothetical protein
LADLLTITESGMTFQLERTRTCQLDALHAGRPSGLKTCEFVTVRPWGGQDAILFVEAKASSPKPGNPSNDFRTWVLDVVAKFAQSVTLLLAVAAGRHPDELRAAFPDALLSPPLLSGRLVPVLILPEHPASTLADLKEILSRELRRLLVAAGVRPPEVVVLNRELATKTGLL